MPNPKAFVTLKVECDDCGYLCAVYSAPVKKQADTATCPACGTENDTPVIHIVSPKSSAGGEGGAGAADE